MNTELKAMLTTLFKSYGLVKDLVANAGVVADMTDVTTIALTVPAVISGFGDVKNEIDALTTPANLADILAFITAQFVGIDSDAHAQKILDAALKLAADIASDGVSLAAAIKG
jgi:hypothetical protein